MEELIKIVVPFIPVAIIAIVIICILFSGYVKASPNEAYIISGLRKKPRILIGKSGVKIPFFEKLDKLSLGAIQIDVKTKSAVPTAEFINVKVDSTVSVQIGKSPEMIALAAQNFLNTSRREIAEKINDLLEGNIREIVGQSELKKMVNDRKDFSKKVQENVVPDLARFGLELISFNVQNFVDDNGVIENLGIDNIEQIRKDAAIAKSNAKREVSIKEAENAKAANDVRVKSEEEIAIKNNDLLIKKAELKKISDTQIAQANAAEEIEAEKQRQLRDVAATNADIAKAEREAELKRKQIELKEYELDAVVRKQADANKYATEKQAEAELISRQKTAEAERFEKEQEALAQKVQADAEKYAAFAKAEGIAAIGEAEAQAIEKKAEAQKKMGQASVLEMVLGVLPEITEAAAAPLQNVDKITMYGADGSNQLVSNIMKTTDQVIQGVKESTGVDLATMLSSYLGAKTAQDKN